MNSIDSIYKLLLKMGRPVAYHHFQVDELNPAPEPPFIIYVDDDTDAFYADDKTYINPESFIVDLITSKKDKKLEQELETLFLNANIPFEKMGDDYIESENVFQIRYLI